jgi:hypothetical protein
MITQITVGGGIGLILVWIGWFHLCRLVIKQKFRPSDDEIRRVMCPLKPGWDSSVDPYQEARAMLFNKLFREVMFEGRLSWITLSLSVAILLLMVYWVIIVMLDVTNIYHLPKWV